MPPANWPRCLECGKQLDYHHARTGCRVKLIPCAYCGKKFSPRADRADNPNSNIYHSRKCWLASRETIIKQDGDIVRIICNRGKYEVIVDASDLELIQPFKWTVTGQGAGRTTEYASGYMPGSSTMKRIPIHRLILSAPDGIEVDHINGNGLDNRRANLRLADGNQNRRNTRARNGKRFKGVRKDPTGKRFIAHIQIGTYDTEEQAARAYDFLATHAFGEFARLNFPGEPLEHPDLTRLKNSRYQNSDTGLGGTAVICTQAISDTENTVATDSSDCLIA